MTDKMWDDADARLMSGIHARAFDIKTQKECCSVGVVGYSNTQYDVAEGARELIFAMSNMKASLEHLHGCNRFKLVSGLTNLGIPKEAYSLAKHILGDDVITVGFACSKAKDFPQFPVDEKHIIGDAWGDESDAFLSSIDGLIRIGGGKQSLDEVKRFKEMYPEKPVIEYDF